jgi:diguanylate cyclase
VLQGSIRASDSLGRVGGEEFLVVAPGTDADGAMTLANRLRTAVEDGQTAYNGQTIRMTISLGLAVAEATTPVSYEQLREVSAEALKEAKESGRNRSILRVIDPPALLSPPG